MIDAPEARRLLSRKEPFYCTMLEPAFQEFLTEGLPLRGAYESSGMWATSGRVLWRRKTPMTRFVIVTRAQ
jgi:hypothetical protein